MSIGVSDYIGVKYAKILRLLHAVQRTDLTDVNWHELAAIAGQALTATTDLNLLWSALTNTAELAQTPRGIMPDVLCRESSQCTLSVHDDARTM